MWLKYFLKLELKTIDSEDEKALKYAHTELALLHFPSLWDGLVNLTDIQAEHSYSLSEDSAPQSPALSVKMDQDSGKFDLFIIS